ncbi:NTP transferase domain-containing protein [Streptomyces sp. bgisy100]|uniref:NTP transferase domain-containing protein n=1 Tax=Streptomyces sp. bgisy100 TaxID=3413783 RepID=UPI003D7605C0
MTAQGYDAVVLAGGAAKRMGGADKPGLRVGGRPLLDRVLGACADATTTVVVGSRRPTARPVRWAREEPPGGGPLAALAAGLAHVTEPVVLALSADLPFLSAETVRALIGALDGEKPGPGPAPAARRDAGPDADRATADRATADRATADRATMDRAGADRDTRAGGAARAEAADTSRAAWDPATARAGEADGTAGNEPADGVLLVDSDGRDQPLVAAYRTEPLRRELSLLAAEHGGLAHLPLRLLSAELTLRRISGPVPAASFDCDTWEDLASARARIREHGNVLDEWMAAVKDELGIELDVDTGVLLDLARDAAHGVTRPAAPLTTFLVGYAAGRAGGTPAEVAEAARRAAALAARWAAESDEGPADGGKTDG